MRRLKIRRAAAIFIWFVAALVAVNMLGPITPTGAVSDKDPEVPADSCRDYFDAKGNKYNCMGQALECGPGYFLRGDCVKVSGCPWGESIPMEDCGKHAPPAEPQVLSAETEDWGGK